MIHRFCVSHTAPLLPESWYDTCIALGDFQSDSASHVRQLDQFWHEARPLAYGAAGSYVLPIAIERFSGSAQLIEISSFRKRILPCPQGIECQTFGYPGLRELAFDNFKKEKELAVFTPRADLHFMVAQPIYLENSVLGQYADSHFRTDILDYTSIAVELNILTSQSASEFLAAKHFIPGGVEFGIFPRPWLVDALSGIERVGRRFLERHGDRIKRYDTYQVRAVGFLSERLGSFLLIRHLKEIYSDRIPADIFGHPTVIVDGNSAYSIGRSGSTALTEQPKNSSIWHRRILKRAR